MTKKKSPNHRLLYHTVGSSTPQHFSSGENLWMQLHKERGLPSISSFAFFKYTYCKMICFVKVYIYITILQHINYEISQDSKNAKRIRINPATRTQQHPATTPGQALDCPTQSSLQQCYIHQNSPRQIDVQKRQIYLVNPKK